jgi:predicted phage terminase large subunit-like protein
LEPLRHISNRDFGAVIFRRTYPQITMEGGMWDEATKLYPRLGAAQHQGRMEFRFPSGARVRFAHLQYDKDVDNYQGAQIPLIGFDQAEQFSQKQFTYLLSRNRSTCGVRPYMRLTCNPDPDSWLLNFLSWWLADDGYARLSRAGKLRWFVRIEERFEWADRPEVLWERFGGRQRPLSATFIPASVYDNKILLAKDPDYLSKLMALLPVERARLLGDRNRGGNWKIRPEAGKVFNRSWFEIVQAVPSGGIECRFWDFAATEKDLKGDEPAYTAGIKIRKVGGEFFVMDCLAAQLGPAATNKLLKNTSRQDAQAAKQTRTRYMVRWEVEGGSAGKRDAANLIKLLAGLNAKGVRPQGDKLTRAKPLAVQAEAGNVKLLAGAWNERWLGHMHHQPDIKEKDIMDASAGAFLALTTTGGVWRG